MNPELNLLNHILKTKDIIDPLNADCAKSFLLYGNEFDYLKEHYLKYREVPPAEVFADKFPNVTVYNTDASMAFYIDEIHKYKARHELQEIITEAAASVKEYGPYSTINKIHSRLSKLGRDTKLVRDLDLVANSDERLENLKERIALRASGKQLIGIPSGFKAIDDAFGGWQRGDFIVVAGWTGSLKSWLCLFFGAHAWSQGYRVLYISLEMSGLQIGYRFDTLLSGGQFSNTGLTHADGIMFDKYKTWLGDSMKDKPPFVVVTNEDLEDVNQSTVLSKIEQWKPDLCILDYHHLFDDASGATGETEKTKNLSKAFKRIALRTGVPIIDITSVTQDKKDMGESPPQLFDLAWSKQLAYDSDLTLGLCRQGDVLEVISRKSRRSKEIHFYIDWDVDAGNVKEIQRTITGH